MPDEPTRNGELPAVTVAAHPAPFSDAIIEKLRVLIPEHVPEGHVIHDPFGGEGKRLGALCDELGYAFTATDLEPWLGADERVAVGDSTVIDWYPLNPFAVVTSPTYNNGVNDHFRPQDGSQRLTYRVRAGRELHPNNTGRYSGRGSKRGEDAYWRLTRDVVKHWPDIAIVNVKDSYRLGSLYPLVGMWVNLLSGTFGYAVRQYDVPCPGWRFGRNGADRAEDEAVLVATRTARTSADD